MKTMELAKKYHNYVVSMRREFHQNPEASMEEYNTSKRIKEELEKMGVEYRSIAGTGVVATLKGKFPGKCIALRGDIDALAVVEENKKEYASKNHGLMHACGHDTHASMLLGAVKVLKEMQDEIHGTVKFFFQPGEEVGKGARKMVEEGALEGVDSIMGIHIASMLPVGTINAEPGPRMAAADKFKITITGKGGHGSAPHQCVDAVVVGAATIMNLQSIVSRELTPLKPAVVTVGSIHSGTRFNVIAPTSVLEGTVRYYEPEYFKTISQAIERIAKLTAETYRAEASVEYENAVKPTINDESCAKLAQETAAKIVGAQNIVTVGPETGGEDFSEFSSIVPGVMTKLGAGNSEKDACYPHHHGKFEVDEDAFIYGVAYYSQYALDYLNTNKTPSEC